MATKQTVSIVTVLGLAALSAVSADFDWARLASQDVLQSGDAQTVQIQRSAWRPACKAGFCEALRPGVGAQGTFYGQQQSQDSGGTCSLSENYANTNHWPWTTGITGTLAINGADFGDSGACGMCVMYRGTGGGMGTTPVPTTGWAMGFVNNRCGECKPGDIDQDLNGNGRYNVEWYAVPCNTGDTPLRYDVVLHTHWVLAFVISNHRIPLAKVQAFINGEWLDLPRQTNNQFAFYRSNGNWEGNFPISIRVTSVLNETLNDVVTSIAGNNGTVQFRALPGPAYVSGMLPGHGVPEVNTPRFVRPPNSTANIGPIKGAGAHGVPAHTMVPTVPLVPKTANATDAKGQSFASDVILVKDYQQCGGIGGACAVRDKGRPRNPCIPSQWPVALCATPGWMCQKANDTMLTCQPAGTAQADASDSADPCAPTRE